MSADLNWRKSSYSGSEGGNCVEVASELPITWRKSSHSNASGGDCIEVSADIPATVAVRDSKDPHGPALSFSSEAWQAFVTELKADEFLTA
ncbi:DUF397 domain-containing protein [Kitasatospora sp. NPDC094028]